MALLKNARIVRCDADRQRLTGFTSIDEFEALAFEKIHEISSCGQRVAFFIESFEVSDEDKITFTGRIASID